VVLYLEKTVTFLDLPKPTQLINYFFFTAATGNCYVDCKHCDFTGPLYECGYENGVSFVPNKVNSVQEACAKCFATHNANDMKK
jgi:hypothetical protein